jgi:alpha-L-fucosidase
MQPEFVTRLNEIGAWLAKNGESVYGTRGGPFSPRPWGAVTQKGNKLYVHVLDWQDEVLAMPAVQGVKTASIMASGAAVDVKQVPGATLLRIPAAQRDPVDTVVVLSK